MTSSVEQHPLGRPDTQQAGGQIALVDLLDRLLGTGVVPVSYTHLTLPTKA